MENTEDCLALVSKFPGLNDRDKSNATYDPHFIRCVEYLRSVTTEPSWIVFFQPYIIIPGIDARQGTIHDQSLIDAGWNPYFVTNVLRYSSGRPVTDITLITNEKNKRYWSPSDLERVVPHRTDLPYIADIDEGLYSSLLLPIVRYERGMSRGLYYPAPTKVYCGIFYYLEPDSNYYLISRTTLVAKNKFGAAMALGLTVEDLFGLYNDPEVNWEAGKEWETSPLRGYLEYRGFDTGEETGIEAFQKLIDSTQTELAYEQTLYGLEDILDQPICLMARQNGIDCVLLKYMTGNIRPVSEVLDTRSREESFENILYPPLQL